MTEVDLDRIKKENMIAFIERILERNLVEWEKNFVTVAYDAYNAKDAHVSVIFPSGTDMRAVTLLKSLAIVCAYELNKEVKVECSEQS